MGDAPAGGESIAPTGTIKGVPVKLLKNDPYERWQEANVVRGITKGTISAMAYAKLGDITTAQFRALADMQRDFQLDVRVTNRQNFALRDVAEADLRALYDRLGEIGMAEPGAELARDVVACPGADTCNLAVTQSRGLAAAIGDALEDAGLAEVPGVRVNISGCTNSCGQHHTSDIGFFGLERRAHGRAAPGYQMLLGGHVGDMQIEFGDKASKVPAKSAPEAVVRIVGRFTEERQPGEEFAQWLARSGGAKGVGDTVKDLDHFPTPEEAPEFFVDYGETGPYVADVGDGECAAT
jgi:sulfite reductase beta subunit-like hemoprotein